MNKIITLLFGLITLFIIGCTEISVDHKEEIQKMQWTYYDFPQLTFTLNKYYNPFKLYEIDAIIVPLEAKTYSINNAIKINPCSATPKTIDFCINPLGLKNRNFSGKTATIWIFTGIKWNLGIDETEKEIASIRSETQASNVYSYSFYIPDVDERGFVDIKFVDDGWCWVETGKNEYGDKKPFCEQAINDIKKKIEHKKNTEFREECSSNCISVYADRCTKDCCPYLMEIIYIANNKTNYRDYLTHIYNHYKKTGEIIVCDESILNNFVAEMKAMGE